jgi:hypothetical protein
MRGERRDGFQRQRSTAHRLDLHVKKSVQFVEQNNTVHYINHRCELTPDEHLSCFFVPSEYTAMRQREHALSRSCDPRLTEHETGLESRRDRSGRRRRIDECVMSVLLEQELRELEGEPMDDLCLARIAQGYSSQSVRLAHSRGFQNAIQVRRERIWPSIPTMPLRALSPTTPKEELLIKMQQQQDREVSAKDKCPTKPARITVSTDYVLMAAAFEPPPMHQMERSPISATPSRTNEYGWASASSTPPDDGSSSPRPFDFVLPPFPVWDETWAYPFSPPPKSKKTNTWYISDQEIEEDRWI